MHLKDRISSPLEAGPSVLDNHYLPPQVNPALEYVSDRLAKKSIHITLVVARRDYQLPSLASPLASPGLCSPGLSAPTTPLSPRFSFANGPVAALKQLVRSSSVSYTQPPTPRSGMTSPCFGPYAMDLPSPRLRWPMTPTTPLSPPPMTPSVSSIHTSDTMGSAMSSGTFGMRLIHASRLPLKREKALKVALEKAEKRFQVGTEWLSPSLNPSACGLTNQLINTSVVQNEVLFSGDGLTLMSLDRLYCLKSALSSYSKTKSYLRLEDAVDELRRMVLANNGQKVTKADLLRSYDWLNVSHWALADLDRMYRRAYGGPEQFGGISGMYNFAEPDIRRQSELEDEQGGDKREEELVQMVPIQIDEGIRGASMLARKSNLTPTPPTKGPLLRLQTSLDASPKALGIVNSQAQVGEEEEDEDRTARPIERNPYAMHAWTESTIDQVVHGNLRSPDSLCPNRESVYGPMTPHEYSDLSPTTKGEWSFLMVDDAFRGGRTVAVETW